MSRMICDNARDIDEIQPLAFVLADDRLVNYLPSIVNILPELGFYRIVFLVFNVQLYNSVFTFQESLTFLR